MPIKIEKNVPRPDRYWWTKYHFGDMKVGDSFFIPGKLSQASVASAAHSFAKRRNNGWKFATSIKSDKAAGVRVWRIK